jgi:hypothetical protein
VDINLIYTLGKLKRQMPEKGKGQKRPTKEEPIKRQKTHKNKVQ